MNYINVAVRCFLILSISLVSTFSWGLHLTEDEQKWIQQNPVVKLGADYAWPPYDFIDDKKQHAGISADVLNLISAKTGLKFSIKAEVWADVMNKMKTKQLDGLACAVKTSQREEFLTFTTPYASMPLAIVVQKNVNNINSLQDLYGKWVAVNKGSYLHEWLVKNHPKIKLLLTHSNSESIHLASTSKVDAYVGNIAVATYIMNHQFLTNLKIVAKIESFKTEVAIAIDKDKPLLASIMQKALGDISRLEKSKILKHWFNASSQPLIELTSEEKLWVKQHPKIIVGGESDWGPIDFIDENKQYAGISKEYLDLIKTRTGLNFEIKIDFWKNSLNALKNKKIDLLAAANKLPEREKYASFSKSYFDVLSYFFVHKDIKVNSFKDLDGKIVAIPKGYSQIKILREQYPGIKLLEVDSLTHAINAVLERKADILFDSYPVLLFVLQNSGIVNIVPFKAPKLKGNDYIHFMVRNDEPLLTSILNKGLDSISMLERRAIYDKWVTVLPSKEDIPRPIDLSFLEKEWLLNNPKVSFAGDPNWLPYEAFNEEGEYIGIIADLVKEIEKKASFNFQIKQTNSWLETLGLSQKKMVDVVSGDFLDPILAKNYNKTAAYFKTPLVILMQDGHGFVEDLDVLTTTTVAVIEGYGYVGKLEEKFPEITFVLKASAEDAINSVSIGEVDAAVMSLPKASYSLKNLNIHNIKVVGKTTVNLQLVFHVLKDKPELLQIIDKSLKSFSKKDKLGIIGKWTKIEFATSIDYWLIVQIVFIMLLIVGIIFYWNLKLNREITQRKQIESDLIDSRSQIKVLIDNVPLYIMVSDYSGQILSANLKLLSDYKMTHEEVLSSNIGKFYANAKDREEIVNLIKEEGKVEQKILYMKNIDGFAMPRLVSVIPIEYEHRPALLSISVDMSERINMEKQLNLAKKRAEKADKAKSEFLANMSHEIRTPMNAILGFTELLGNQVTSPRHKSFVKTINSAGKTLLNLINDILDLSKIEAGKMDIILKPTDLENMFKEISDIFIVNAHDKGLDFIIEIDKKLPSLLLIDEMRLRQVLFNLIGNAVKFTETGFIKISVLVENLKSDKLNIVLLVADSGIGISKGQTKSIFESFQQQVGQDEQKFGGTGLGLSISKRLVELMGGQISVTSEQGKGSVFKVYLNNVDIALVKSTEQNSEQDFNVELVKFSQATILVVDDVFNNRELIKQSLAPFTLDIKEAENGKIAVDYCKSHPVDLVLMDIRMPVMDGYEATKIIKGYDNNLPIIAITASISSEDMEKIKSFQFDFSLRKPVARHDLLTSLMKFLPYELEEKSKELVEQDKYEIIVGDDLDLIADLSENTFLLFKVAENSKNIDKIKEFSLIVKDIAIKFKNSDLEDFSIELASAVDNFDVQAMKRLLAKFKRLYEKIK